MFGGNWAPRGWAFCSGQGLPISDYETLFNLIGTTFGGDGVETFNLPNLCGRVPIHMGSFGGQTFQLGESGGTETVTLTTPQLPQHNHPFFASTSPGSADTGASNLTAETAQLSIYEESSANVPLNAAAISTVGDSQPHENMQPFICVTFIISLYGTYPSQT
jgi:microcystin-dependent protein